jgi:phage terminase small subunit
MTELNPRQDRFCQEYLVDLNATQAAIRAGYSAASAGEHSSELLKNPNIQARVGALKAEREAKTGISAEKVLQQFWDIASYRIEDILDFDGEICTFKPLKNWPRSAKAAVSMVKYNSETRGTGDNQVTTTKLEFKSDDRLRALDSIAKHLGMFDSFPGAISTLKTYGIELKRNPEGEWVVAKDEHGY